MILFLILFLAVGCTSAKDQASLIKQNNPIEIKSENFSVEYPLKNASDKLVDNRGNGFEPLYGTRNFRAVLKGIYYRGGANNTYHRSNKRDNMNPLPTDGIEHLCEEGFTKAIYLYTENFNTAPKAVNCKLNQNGADNRIEYVQFSSLSSDSQNIYRIISLIYDHIVDGSKNAIYAHCWNGWHASGFAAATALKQFCGFNGEQAVRYWNMNTDGNSSGYDSIRAKIRNFEPYPEFIISEAAKQKICPDPQTFDFPFSSNE